jgi:ATP-dependent Clp protease ATP-binding subunit ClpA
VAQPAGDIAQEQPLDRDHVQGFETSASDCLKRAVQIARSLNHADLSSDHLMLALTMDENARRQIERFGDVVQLREVAMERLGRNYTRSSAHSSDLSPAPTSDLADIGKRAREAAAEREQLVSISDLINAFPKENGRLTYAAGAGTQALALMEKIEQGLVPRVGDAMDRIEATVQNALQRHQTVQNILEDLGYRARENEQRQKDLMDEVRRQVREIADAQLAALRDFDVRLDTKLAELDRRASEQANPGSQEGNLRRSYLSRLLS